MLTMMRNHLRVVRYASRVRAAARGVAPIALLFQMGKVGSTALWRALETRPDVAPFRAHILSPTGRAEWRVWGNDTLMTPNRRYRGANTLFEHLIEPRIPLKVITMVRDPIERDISDFFENVVGNETKPVDGLLERFVSTFDPDRARLWYREEFEAVLGVDLLGHPFDPELGWQVIPQSPFEVLVLRTTLPDDEKARQVADFLALDGLDVSRANRTNDKPINALYEEFKGTLRLSAEVLDALTANAFTQHFFSSGEIDAMRARWLG